VVLVATQVVEAGVDVDFDAGWREWGPLESLVQVAGRINRNARGPGSKGELRLVELVEGQGGFVYGRVLLDAAREVMSGPLSDREVEQELDAYFATIERRLAQDRAQQLVAALSRLDYDRPGVACRGGGTLPVRCFHLIEEPLSLRIVVEQDERASEMLRRLREAYRIEDPNRRRLVLRQLHPLVERYTVTPLLRRALGNLPRPLFHDREEPRLIRREELGSFYDEETGFKWEISQFL
jgi:CRISPR-associated endonuclease/helicase Cas3